MKKVALALLDSRQSRSLLVKELGPSSNVRAAYLTEGFCDLESFLPESFLPEFFLSESFLLFSLLLDESDSGLDVGVDSFGE